MCIKVNNSTIRHIRKREREGMKKRGGGVCTSLAEGDLALVGLGLGGGVFGLAGGALGQVGLVTLALGVSQVVPLVVVQRQAKLAFIAANKQTHGVQSIRNRNVYLISTEIDECKSN